MSNHQAAFTEHAFVKQNAAGLAVQRARRKNPEDILAQHLGQPFVDYRRRWKESESFETVPPFPIHLDVDTNYTCNLRCSMCPLGEAGRAVGYDVKSLDKDLYARVIEEGAKKGLASVRLGLTGEPLMRPDIIDFIDLAREAGLVDIMLITNGMLLTAGLSIRLINSGLTRLQVSIDAVTEDVYRQIRRRGSLDQVQRNIDSFLKLRRQSGQDLPLLRVSFVRTAVNLHQREEFEDLWHQKADYVSIQEYADLLGTPESRALFPDDRTRTTTFKCPDPFQRLALFVNGDLFGCCSDHGRTYPWGNANVDRIEDVWHSEAAKELREIHRHNRWYDHPACRECGVNSVAILPTS